MGVSLTNCRLASKVTLPAPTIFIRHVNWLMRMARFNPYQLLLELDFIQKRCSDCEQKSGKRQEKKSGSKATALASTATQNITAIKAKRICIQQAKPSWNGPRNGGARYTETGKGAISGHVGQFLWDGAGQHFISSNAACRQVFHQSKLRWQCRRQIIVGKPQVMEVG